MCVELVIGISSDVGSSVNQMHVSSGICQFTSEDAACKAGTDDQNSCLMSGHRYFSERQKVKSAQPVDGLRLANESLGMLRFRMGVRDDSATVGRVTRSEEHTSELQSLMRISYAVSCSKKKKKHTHK